MLWGTFNDLLLLPSFAMSKYVCPCAFLSKWNPNSSHSFTTSLASSIARMSFSLSVVQASTLTSPRGPFLYACHNESRMTCRTRLKLTSAAQAMRYDTLADLIRSQNFFQLACACIQPLSEPKLKADLAALKISIAVKTRLL